jgi:Protein of unknown function DUF262
MTRQDDLDRRIDEEMTELRTDKLDVSYGELANMYEQDELIIDPEFQRLFRWTIGQKSLFIESILLGFPTPAIFVAETDKGIWELVDGVQRISTVLEYMGRLKTDDELVPATKLSFATDRHPLTELEGYEFNDLSLRSKLSIKRAGCRVEVIKIISKPNMKYEVFERLNTGGSGLSHQEVRNCVFRASDPVFMNWIDELSQISCFSENLGIPQTGRFGFDEMYDKGLVLRFFTLKNNSDSFINEVEPFITDYMRKVVGKEVEFDKEKEDKAFRDTFKLIAECLGDDSWRHYKDGSHNRKQFSVYVFDAISIGVAMNLDIVKKLDTDEIRERCLKVKTDPDFVGATGSGKNTKVQLKKRLDVAVEIIGGGQRESG